MTTLHPEQDHYAILGVPPRASEQTIRAAYRRLAKSVHPDLASTPGTTREMQRINEAYRVLGDPTRRRRYDDHLRLAEWLRSRSADMSVDPARPQPPPGGSAPRQHATRPALRRWPQVQRRVVAIIRSLAPVMVVLLVIALTIWVLAEITDWSSVGVLMAIAAFSMLGSACPPIRGGSAPAGASRSRSGGVRRGVLDTSRLRGRRR